MELDTWNNLAVMFFDQAAQHKDKPFLWSKHDGRYQSISWNDAANKASAIANGLLAHGIEAGDRVMLVSENRPEWPITEIAVLSIGAILVPAYTTNTVADHQHILVDSGAKAAVVSTDRLAQPLLLAAEKAETLKFVCHLEPVSSGNSLLIALKSLIADGEQSNTDIPASASQWERDRAACIIYTSGTGGLPKGVVLHHGAILHNCVAAKDALLEMGLDDEVFLSFLPLSHSYEHMAGQFFPICVGAQIYYAEGIESLATNMAEAQPTIMTAVPRLYETMHQKITRGVQKQGGLKEKLFNTAYTLGKKRYQNPTGLSLTEKLTDRLVDKLVRDKVRARFGGRLKALVSGGAPLNPDIGQFFTALGLRILQGYGQTESAPVIAVNRPSGPKMHTVGPIVKNTEVRIAEDGEILCRGDLVMQAYWNNETATQEAIRDGWLHTGDIGEFDADGHLLITDRKKDIIVNSGGDNIAPQRIEGMLCLEPEIAQAMVYGDKRPNLVALIVPDETWVQDWKKSSNRTESLADLKTDPDFTTAIKAVLDRVNGPLSNIEKVRRYILADEPFSIDNSEMTPTMKIRRHVLKQRYGEGLEALYR